MSRPRLLSIRALLRRLRDAGGFGLIELTIALSILAIATVALTGVFVASHLTLRRASQSDAAAVLSDKLLERFRSELWDNIALYSSQVRGTDSTYYRDPSPLSDPGFAGLIPWVGSPPLSPARLGYDITEADAPLAKDGTPTAGADCANTPEPVTCYPTQTEVGPDQKSYRLDTYITWGCPDTTWTLGGTMPAPTCSNGTNQPNAPVKVVTIVVRDAATLASVYRTSTTFDRLGGDSVPPPTAVPSGSGSGGSGPPPPVTSVPNPPDSVSIVNGAGSGSPCPCITGPPGLSPGNEGSLSFDVKLPSTSLSSDRVEVVLTDGNPADTAYSTGFPATQGTGIVHVTGVDGTGLAEGTITVSAIAINSAGQSAPTVASVPPTKDTTPPSGLWITTPTDGATGVSRVGPFVGTAGYATGDRNTVTLQFCASSSWTCGSSPSQTATASVGGSGNWSLTLASQLQNNHAYTMRIVQADAAGNSAQSPYVSFHT
jgi:type II secretory pathway pseudopilin PulG